ncbi:ribonuclease H-like domain-containing protein [Tanacetum coccineum]|uniref:Ribonuclease H-like domain-containing protein n=1 Tax=Tanacetum coccineum TaxID=301880 RepID=A0ABQ5FD36_9ASTR
MWMYSTISPKLVEMVVDDDTSAHGVWKRLKDLFHNNKDARVTQLDNEIRNMAIGSLFVTDFFQEIKSKADRLANLDSPMKDTSLVTYVVNGIQNKYPDAARVIRLREKAPTFDELWSMMLLEESDMSHKSVSLTLFHNTPSSPTVLVASTTPTIKANTMSTSGFDVCRNFQRGSCSYGARYVIACPSATSVGPTSCIWSNRPISAYCVFLGDNLLSWSAKRQVTLSRSSAEAEYRGVANVVAETAWIRNLLLELHAPLTTATLVYCDNVSAVYLSTNPVQHQRTKHIEIDIHFVRDYVASGQVRVLHVPSRFQYADIFTKGLPTALFLEFCSSLNVRRPPIPTAEEY